MKVTSAREGVPVSVDVRGAEGVAVVQQRGVDQHVVLGIIHQIRQVAQVAVAAADAVSGAVLVQDEDLTGAEPTLETNTDPLIKLPSFFRDLTFVSRRRRRHARA